MIGLVLARVLSRAVRVEHRKKALWWTALLSSGLFCLGIFPRHWLLALHAPPAWGRHIHLEISMTFVACLIWGSYVRNYRS